MIDIDQHITGTLREHLEAQFSAAGHTVRVEQQHPRDLSGASNERATFPTLTIDAARGDDSEVTRGDIYKTTIDETNQEAEIIYRRGYYSATIDLWLYTQSKTQRLELEDVLTDILYPLVDGNPRDLEIEIANYFGAGVRFVVLGSTNKDSEVADHGYAAKMYRVRAHTVRLQRVVRPLTTHTAELETVEE